MSLINKALNGLKWTTASTIILTVLQLAQMSVLARFLDPGDFGLMAIMMVVIGFSQAFQDMGISNAIIQRQHITHTQLSSLYWLNIAAGAVLTLIIIAIAPLVAKFYDEPRITPLMILLSTTFMLVAIGNQYRVLFQKNLNFRTMEIINVSTSLVSLIVAGVMAYQGYGVLTLVCAMLTQAGLSSMLFLFIGLKHYHKPSLVYKHSELEGFYGFGLYQMGERSVNYISGNADKIIIGKLIGVNAVGFYNLAWQLIIFPLSKINPIINKVAFPVYSKVQNDPIALNSYYTANVKVLSLLTMPLLAFLIFFSSQVVNLIFGEGWDTTASLLPILALVGILKALGNPGGALILAKGRADVGFWWNVIWAITIVLSLVIGLILRPTLYDAVYILLATHLTVGLIWHVLISRIGGIKYLNIVIHFIKTFIAVIAIAWTSSILLNLFTIKSNLLHIILGSVLCLAFYITYLIIFERKLLRTVREMR